MWLFRRNKQQYNTGDSSDFDPDLAIGHIQDFARNAPLDVQQSVYQQHFAHLPYEHRLAIAQQVPRRYRMDPDDPAAMAYGFARFGQERPGMLERIFRHPLLLGGTVALAGLIVKHRLTRREREADAQPYDDDQGPWWIGRSW